jgi:excisionase family DNA binding protein
MTIETPPGMAEAAKLLGLTTREVVQLVYERKIRFIVVDGIPRIPEDAIEEYRKTA